MSGPEPKEDATVDRPFFLAMTAFALLVLYFYLVYSVLAPFLGALLWAAVLGIATFPLFRKLRRRLKGRNNLAAALMTPAVILVLAVPLIAVFLFLIVELDALYNRIQVAMLEGKYPSLERLGHWPLVATLLEYLRPITEDFQIDLKESVTPAVQNLIAALMEQSQKAAGKLIEIVLETVVMIITLFFVFRNGEGFIDRLSSLIPLPDDRKALLGERTKTVLSAILYGVFLTAVVQGNLALIGYWLVGLQSPVLLGILTAIASLIPVTGTALVWAPAALYLLGTGKTIQGVILLLWGTIVVSSSDNFIRPYLISGRGRVPFMAVMLGILGGLAVFGLPGIVVGPTILALFFSVTDLFRPLLPASRNSIIPPP